MYNIKKQCITPNLIHYIEIKNTVLQFFILPYEVRLFCFLFRFLNFVEKPTDVG